MDDGRDSCERIQLTLKGLGFEVLLCHSGEEGLCFFAPRETKFS